MGYGDLADTEQQALFRAALPSGKMQLTRYEGSTVLQGTGIVSDADIAGARFRLVQRTDYWLPALGNPYSYIMNTLPSSTGRSYSMSFTGPPPAAADTLDGVPVKFQLPNRLKPAQTNLDSALFNVSVPLTGVKTVHDLIFRIGKLTSLECYADPRFGGLPLTSIPASGSATASNLLKALAFCLTGTYRVVGPAVLLTHDLRGVGAQVELLAEMNQEFNNRWTALRNRVRDSLSASHNVLELPPGPDSPAFSPAQLKQMQDATRQGDPIQFSALPSELTATQRDVVSRIAESQNRHADSIAAAAAGQGHPDDGLRVDTTMAVKVFTEPAVQVLLPSLDAPVDAHQAIPVNMMLSRANGAGPSRPAVPPLLQVAPRRAVILAPASPAVLDVALASMQKLELNELWLVVSSPGRPWRTAGGSSGKTTGGTFGQTLLRHAVEACGKNGIAVYAVVDLLDGGASTLAGMRDRNILGEDSAAAAKRAAALTTASEVPSPRDVPTAAIPAALPAVITSPLSPAVAEQLSRVCRDLAGEPGIAGVVWRIAARPGYVERASLLARRLWSTDNELAVREFGYSEEARLSFLRRFSVDPIDINPIPRPGADVTLPGFSNPALDEQYRRAWLGFRREADVRMLRSLLAASQVGSRSLPVLVGVGSDQNWYGSWDDPRKDPPVLTASPHVVLAQLGTKAKQISHQALVSIWENPPVDPAILAMVLKIGVAHSDWDGYVLDFDPTDTPGLEYRNPLADLEAAASAPLFARGAPGQ
ncbi:MAG: hypothetical protein LC772_08205 [Chloroflexi bacterium]|nr:hypothetical protein [Chloroflexota bacterium]